MEQGRPFPIVYNVGDMYEGYKRLEKLATSHRLIVPGHEPLMLKRYPAPRAELGGISVRLNVEPNAE